MSDKNTIVVVDDDESTRTIVKTILVANSFEVMDFSRGADALAWMQTTTPDLAVLDIMMPEMSGYDVLTRMKQHPNTQNIPVIFLTAKGDPDDVLSGYKDFCVEYYITKPFTSQQLIAGIKLVLGSLG